jgi:hypothetical protein
MPPKSKKRKAPAAQSGHGPAFSNDDILVDCKNWAELLSTGIAAAGRDEALLDSVVFVVEGAEHKVAANLICAFAPPFRMMLSRHWKEGSSRRIDLPEVSSVAFEAILSHVHTGKATIAMNAVLDVLRVACIYDVAGLKSCLACCVVQQVRVAEYKEGAQEKAVAEESSHSSELVARAMDEGTQTERAVSFLFDALSVALAMGPELCELKEACTSCIALNSSAALASHAFTQCQEDVVQFVIKAPLWPTTSHVEIFQALVRWHGEDATSKNKAFRRCLGMLPFSLFTAEEFKNIIEPTQVMERKENTAFLAGVLRNIALGSLPPFSKLKVGTTQFDKTEDNQGLVWGIATRNGSRPWHNPASEEPSETTIALKPCVCPIFDYEEYVEWNNRLFERVGVTIGEDCHLCVPGSYLELAFPSPVLPTAFSFSLQCCTFDSSRDFQLQYYDGEVWQSATQSLSVRPTNGSILQHFQMPMPVSRKLMNGARRFRLTWGDLHLLDHDEGVAGCLHLALFEMYGLCRSVSP